MNNQKKQTGKVNYIWVLAGGYLICLAIKVFREVFLGRSSNPVFSIVGGVVFVAIGLAVMLREWRAYQYGLKHIDDPSTWSDEPEELPEGDVENTAEEQE